MEFEKLLPSQKKRLFDLIIAEGLNPSNFEATTNIAFIKYLGTEFKFRIRRAPNKTGVIVYSPGNGVYQQVLPF